MSEPHPFLYRVRSRALVLCAVVWVSAFVATHIPVPPVAGPRISDKWLHGIGYFVLFSMLAATLAGHRAPRLRRIVGVLVVTAVYGAFDEVTQPLVGRTASLGDWTADVIGGALAALAVEGCLLLAARKERKGRAERSPADDACG